MASVLSPMYIAEMAPADRRGGLVAWNQFAIIFGMLVVYFVNYAIALSGDEAWLTSTGWRLMFLSEVIPAALLLILVTLVPESPRWLIMRGREKDAFQVLERINDPQGAQKEAEAIRTSFAQVVRSKLFTYGVTVIVIGMLLSVFQQFIGINVVLYYAPEIFRNMGMETNAALAQTIIVGVINLSFTVLAIFTVDRFGRKPLMIIGSIGMAISMFTLGMAFYTHSMGLVALLAMLCYVASFAMSWGPICWVLLSEIFPNAIRSQAMALAVGRPMDCQLPGLLDLPHDGQILLPDRTFQPRIRLLDLRLDGHFIGPVHVAVRPGNQREKSGTDGNPIPKKITNSTNH